VDQGILNDPDAHHVGQQDVGLRDGRRQLLRGVAQVHKHVRVRNVVEGVNGRQRPANRIPVSATRSDIKCRCRRWPGWAECTIRVDDDAVLGWTQMLGDQFSEASLNRKGINI